MICAARVSRMQDGQVFRLFRGSPMIMHNFVRVYLFRTTRALVPFFLDVQPTFMPFYWSFCGFSIIYGAASFCTG